VTVTVTAPPPSPPTPSLSVRAYKVKGIQKADLSWNGFSSTSIDVYRNGTRIKTTANDGADTDAINLKGTGNVYLSRLRGGDDDLLQRRSGRLSKRKTDNRKTQNSEWRAPSAYSQAETCLNVHFRIPADLSAVLYR
jgi:hypothetical protein